MKYDKAMIGERVKEARIKKSLTQLEVRNYCGVSQATISGIENGTKLPTMSILAELCEVLDCSLSYLLGEDDNREEIEGDLAKLKSWSEAKVKHLNRMMEELEDISSAWEDAIKACDRTTRKLRGVRI